MRLIFIDTDIQLGDLISNTLKQEYNYQVHFQNTTLGILSTIENFSPDMIVLDVKIGKEDGIECSKMILQRHPHMPVIFLSSHKDENTIANGINAGAVAYLTKPVSIPMLMSYIKRFASKQDTQILKLSEYHLNLFTKKLFYKNKLVKKLSPLEKQALELLMKNPNTIVSKEQLSEKLWGHPFEKENTACLHNLMSKLRELLSENNSMQIHTVRGVGYMLNCK